MELIQEEGYFDNELIQVELPTHQIVKKALLNLDYSQRVITNTEAAAQLAVQFCLDDKQKNLIKDNGVNIWRNKVGGAIQDLAIAQKIVRTKEAAFITLSALESMIVNFANKLGYEFVEEVNTEEKQNDDCEVFLEIKTKTIKGKGIKLSIIENQ